MSPVCPLRCRNTVVLSDLETGGSNASDAVSESSVYLIMYFQNKLF